MKLFTLSVLALFLSEMYAQSSFPFIKIDGDTINALNEASGGTRLPFWLDSSQTLEAGDGIASISVIEFDVSGGNLAYSDVLTVTSLATVPANRVWKIESFAKDGSIVANTANVPPPFSFNGNTKLVFDGVGSYEFVIPPGITTINVQAWGGGGAGGNVSGGGGGGYAITNLSVTPGNTIYITVGGGAQTEDANGENSGIGSALGLTDIVNAQGGFSGDGAINVHGAGGGYSTTYGINGTSGYCFDPGCDTESSRTGGSSGSYTEDAGGVGSLNNGPNTMPGGGGFNGSPGSQGRVIIKY